MSSFTKWRLTYLPLGRPQEWAPDFSSWFRAVPGTLHVLGECLPGAQTIHWQWDEPRIWLDPYGALPDGQQPKDMMRAEETNTTSLFILHLAGTREFVGLRSCRLCPSLRLGSWNLT